MRQNRPQAPCRPRRAFSAVELLVVVALLSILSLGSWSVFVQSRRAALLETDARKIESLMRTARSWAVARGAVYQVAFWREKEVWWIDEIDPFGAIIRPKLTTPEAMNGLVDVAQVLGGVENPAMNTVAVPFRPDGSSVEAYVQIRRTEADPNDSSEYATVQVHAATGQAFLHLNERRP